MNNSEFEANQFLTQTVKRYNKPMHKKQNTISGFAVFVGVFGAIGFLLSIAYFA